jgi:uncharacterized integral membrane protein
MAEVSGPGPAPVQGSKPPRDRKRDTRFVVLGVVAVLLVWFAVDNRQSVPVHFWIQTAHAPIFLVIIITAVLSVGATWLIMRRRRGSRER